MRTDTAIVGMAQASSVEWSAAAFSSMILRGLNFGEGQGIGNSPIDEAGIARLSLLDMGGKLLSTCTNGPSAFRTEHTGFWVRPPLDSEDWIQRPGIFTEEWRSSLETPGTNGAAGGELLNTCSGARMRHFRVASLMATLVWNITVAQSASADPIGASTIGGFFNPVPSCPPATCSGVGGSTITWGLPNPTTSSVTFRGRNFVADPNQPAVMGDIDYFNGSSVIDTGISSVLLSIQFFYEDGSIGGISRTLTIFNSINTDDPRASADSLMVQIGPEFFVFEEDFASATLLFKWLPIPIIASNLSINAPPTLAEQFEIEFLGFGEVTQGNGFLAEPAAVPEPSSLWLLCSGLFVGLVRARRVLGQGQRNTQER